VKSGPELDEAVAGHFYAKVTTLEEYADATCTGLREQFAHVYYIFHRGVTLVKTVRRADRLRDALLIKDQFEPGDEPVRRALRPTVATPITVTYTITHHYQ
jgi:hypothetical protein